MYMQPYYLPVVPGKCLVWMTGPESMFWHMGIKDGIDSIQELEIAEMN